MRGAHTAMLALASLVIAGCAPGGAAETDGGHIHDHDHGDIFPPDTGPRDARPLDDAPPIDGGAESWTWVLPNGFPMPRVPDDNPMSVVKVELGRHLFYDTRLSGNGSQSCASCHEQALAFTDGRARSIGSTGALTPRSSMSLANIAYPATLTWANPFLLELETQAAVPLFGREPIELGLSGMEDALLARLRAEPRYQVLFQRAFPAEADAFTVQNMVRAISSFERTLISGGSAFDRFVYGGDPTALSDSARRGFDLFRSERLECFHCHTGFDFSDSLAYQDSGPREVRFHNTGLYNIGGTGAYPAGGQGLFETTMTPTDMGRFRVPTLRNIAVTAPYMHDGSAATLDDVLDHYAAAGRTILSGPNAGVGSASPYRSGLLIGFTLTPEERADLHAFFDSLTDEAFLTNPALATPWDTPCSLCDSP